MQSKSNPIEDKPEVQTKTMKILDVLWPIKKHELTRFFLLTLLMFSILGVQNLIRALKDSIINTMIGSETVVFLKFWGVLPLAFLFSVLYVKLTTIFKNEKIFYLMIIFFLSFFAAFAFFLFPNHEMVHFSNSKVQTLINDFPHFKWFILLLSKWSFSIFYIISELWPVIVFSLLYWQFVNSITTIEESKRFYPVFGLLGQTGLIFSGQLLVYLDKINIYIQHILNINVNFETFSIQLITVVVLVLGTIALTTFWFLNNQILDHDRLREFRQSASKKKHNSSFFTSINIIFESKYIRLITLLLLCYGMAINLVEGPWKGQISAKYTNTTEFAAFVGSYLSYTGMFTLIFVLIGSNIVRRLGWLYAAIITPLVVFITGLLFFICSGKNHDIITGFFVTLSTDPVMLAISAGAIQNVLSKSTKYTLFDSTKEMSYIPLDRELKSKGKAAADIIGVKLGKSMSAFIQSSIFIIFPFATYRSISNILMFIFAIVCIVWLYAVLTLNKEYKKACSSNQHN